MNTLRWNKFEAYTKLSNETKKQPSFLRFSFSWRCDFLGFGLWHRQKQRRNHFPFHWWGGWYDRPFLYSPRKGQHDRHLDHPSNQFWAHAQNYPCQFSGARVGVQSPPARVLSKPGTSCFRLGAARQGSTTHFWCGSGIYACSPACRIDQIASSDFRAIDATLPATNQNSFRYLGLPCDTTRRSSPHPGKSPWPGTCCREVSRSTSWNSLRHKGFICRTRNANHLGSPPLQGPSNKWNRHHRNQTGKSRWGTGRKINPGSLGPGRCLVWRGNQKSLELEPRIKWILGRICFCGERWIGSFCHRHRNPRFHCISLHPKWGNRASSHLWANQ